MSRPRIFIGSSKESEGWARALQSELHDQCFPVVWTQALGGFGLSSTLEDLVTQLHLSDFAALIATPDDMYEKRGSLQSSARDNIIYELGLFCGQLGRSRSFLLCPFDAEIHLPSDLNGISTARFRYQVSPGERRASMGPAATEIRAAISRLGPRSSPEEFARRSRSVLHQAIDLLDDIFQEAPLTGQPPSAMRRDWIAGVLEVVFTSFADRASDVTVAWLRPETDGVLSVYRHFGFDPGGEHYRYGPGEGLVGRVWSTAEKDMHSTEKPSPRWLPRLGCENSAYLCVPLGGRMDSLGVLGVGSNSGFSISEDDLYSLQVFARILAIAAQKIEGASDRCGEQISDPRRRS
jgi:hypothetical protein